MTSRTIHLIAIMLTLCFISIAHKAYAFSVDQIRFGVHPDKVRMVLDMSERQHYRVFTLSNPYRLVIDLPEFEWQASPIETLIDTGITSVRHGRMQNNISRIVFDFDTPIEIKNAFDLGKNGQKPDRLVIDFQQTDNAHFVAQKDMTFGTLQVDLSPPGVTSNTAIQQASSQAIAPTPPPQQKNYKPLIVIDPGHGGVDPGAIGANDVYEKHVTLKLSKELRDQLLKTGLYRVKMTREDDIFIKLYDRVRFARQHDADLFVSIHADSIDRKDVKGASVYTLSEKASDSQTARLAERENQADLIAGIDLTHEDEDVANILLDLAMRDTMNQSKFFANTMVASLQSSRVRLLKTPHRYAGFAVLKAPDIPSILVEAGFMSNRKEAKMLNTKSHRSKIAQALVKGIDGYFEQVKKNQRI